MINVDQLVAPFAEEDHDVLRRYAIGREQWLAATYPDFDAEALVPAWTAQYAKRLKWHRLRKTLIGDFRIEEEAHGQGLWYAIQGARQAYEADRVSLQRDKREVRELAELAEGILETIARLGGLIASGRLVDEMATATTDAFGPGVSRPSGPLIGDDGPSQDAIAWLERHQSVEMALRETTARLAAIGEIARTKRKARHQLPNDPVKAAVLPLIVFWRMVLKRPFHENHNLWNQPGTKDLGPFKDWWRGDRFVYDVLKALGAPPDHLEKLRTVLRPYGEKKAPRGPHSHTKARLRPGRVA